MSMVYSSYDNWKRISAMRTVTVNCLASVPMTLGSKTASGELRTTCKWYTWAEEDVQTSSKVLLLQPQCMNVLQHATCQGSSFGACQLSLSSMHSNTENGANCCDHMDMDVFSTQLLTTTHNYLAITVAMRRFSLNTDSQRSGA